VAELSGANEPVLISLLIMLETEWVLRRHYDLSKAEFTQLPQSDPRSLGLLRSGPCSGAGSRILRSMSMSMVGRAAGMPIVFSSVHL
jgi:hypothetical protein